LSEKPKFCSAQQDIKQKMRGTNNRTLIALIILIDADSNTDYADYHS